MAKAKWFLKFGEEQEVIKMKLPSSDTYKGKIKKLKPAAAMGTQGQWSANSKNLFVNGHISRIKGSSEA